MDFKRALTSNSKKVMKLNKNIRAKLKAIISNAFLDFGFLVFTMVYN